MEPLDKYQHLAAEFSTGPIEQIIPTLKSPIKEVAEAFLANMKRVNDSHQAVRRLAGLAGRWQGLYSRAMHEVTGKAFLEDAERAPYEKAIVKRLLELHALPEKGTHENQVLERRELEESMWDLIHFKTPSLEADAGFAAQRESMIIGAWTAVEVCIGSLWDTLKEHPYVKPRNGSRERIMLLYENAAPGMPRSSVKTNKGDERTKSTHGMREAFGRGFDRDSAQIDAALADLHIEALALIRNLLVHKNGQRPDSEFDKRGPLIPSLKPFFTGPVKRIMLDGVVVHSYIMDAMHPCCNLLQSLNIWITKNPFP